MSKRTTLPRKPSDLIRVAMDDLTKVERLKGYYVDMTTWHQRYRPGDNLLNTRGLCHVCFAGAVMAQTLGSDPDKYITPQTFNSDTQYKLSALDSFRCGQVGMAFEEMGLDPRRGEDFNRDVPHYHLDRRGFKLAMRRLIRDLAKAKL